MSKEQILRDALDAVSTLRLALAQAECAIKGREHTGFITKALVATEHIDTNLTATGATEAPAAVGEVRKPWSEPEGCWHFQPFVGWESIGDGTKLYTAPPSPTPAKVKDHVLREVVNSLRDIAIQFHGAGQLRERLRAALDPLLSPAPAAEDVTGAAVASQMAERKTADLLTRGYRKIGYVLANEGGTQYAISDSSVRWLSQPQYWRLMHEQDGSLFASEAGAGRDAAPMQTRFMDEIDAATVGEKWLAAIQTRDHRRAYVDDTRSQAPRVKWGALFDQWDKLTHAYLLTRDAMNWTQLTLVDVAKSAPALPVVAEPHKTAS